MQRGFRVTGRVQGVYFRVWTQGLAEDLGLRGTVFNCRDGSVEAHVQGPQQQVAAFEARLWDGPPASKVEGVEQVDSTAELPAAPFRILPTVR